VFGEGVGDLVSRGAGNRQVAVDAAALGDTAFAVVILLFPLALLAARRFGDNPSGE